MILIIYLALSTYLMIFFFLFFCFYKKETGIRDHATKKVEGEVFGYAVTKSVSVPKVYYYVEGVRYKQILSYEMVVKRPGNIGHPIEPDELRHHLITTLKLVNPVSKRTFETLFPIGTKLAVYYNPKNPKQSFVERYDNGHKIFRFFCKWIIIIEILFTILIISIYFLTN